MHTLLTNYVSRLKSFKLNIFTCPTVVTLKLIQAGSRAVVEEKSATTGLASPLEAVITTEQDSSLSFNHGCWQGEERPGILIK